VSQGLQLVRHVVGFLFLLQLVKHAPSSRSTSEGTVIVIVKSRRVMAISQPDLLVIDPL
jgi:hypothetical protein